MMPTRGRLEYGESSCGSTADSDAYRPNEYQGGASMASGWGSQRYEGGRNAHHDDYGTVNPHEQQRGPWKMAVDSLRPSIDQMSSWRQQEDVQHGTSVLDACRQINKKAREDEVLALRLKLEKRQAALEAKAKRLGMQGIQRSGRPVLL
jgi:hypothetical protein